MEPLAITPSDPVSFVLLVILLAICARALAIFFGVLLALSLPSCAIKIAKRTSASADNTLTTTTFVYSGVLFREWMIPFAMGLHGVDRCNDAHPAHCIFTRHNWLQMRRVKAGAISAKMIELVVGWNRPYQNQIRGSMYRANLPDAINRGACRPISFGSFVPRPDPANTLIIVKRETLSKIHTLHERIVANIKFERDD